MRTFPPTPSMVALSLAALLAAGCAEPDPEGSGFASRRVGDESMRATLFESILARTEAREAFSPVKNESLGLDPLEAMRALRERVVAADTEEDPLLRAGGSERRPPRPPPGRHPGPRRPGAGRQRRRGGKQRGRPRAPPGGRQGVPRLRERGAGLLRGGGRGRSRRATRRQPGARGERHAGGGVARGGRGLRAPLHRGRPALEAGRGDDRLQRHLPARAAPGGAHAGGGRRGRGRGGVPVPLARTRRPGVVRPLRAPLSPAPATC